MQERPESAYLLYWDLVNVVMAYFGIVKGAVKRGGFLVWIPLTPGEWTVTTKYHTEVESHSCF